MKIKDLKGEVPLYRRPIQGPGGVLGMGAVSHERGTPVEHAALPRGDVVAVGALAGEAIVLR
jgi:hypothetical protein